MRRLIAILFALGLLAGTVGAQEMFYVIKVTPTLVYIDVGKRGGAAVGQLYTIARAEDDEGSYNSIGEVRVIRVFEEFSIAEIAYQVEGEQFEKLQRAIASEVWEQMVGISGAMGAKEQMLGGKKVGVSSRSIAFFLGGDWSKGTDGLRYFETSLVGVERTGGAGLGVRLGNVFGDKWRLNLTYRISGEALGAGEVTQLSIEADLHYILRGNAMASPYLGLGVGMHQLSWDAPVDAEDSANKLGVNFMGGLQLPMGRGSWSLILEGGYQRVVKFDALIDASHVSTYIGLAKNF